MKYFILVIMFLSFSSLADDSKKLNPIIFMLDLSVSEGKKEQAEAMGPDISENAAQVDDELSSEGDDCSFCLFPLSSPGTCLP